MADPKLLRKVEDLEKANKDLYNRVAERDANIDTLNQEFETKLSNISKTVRDLRNELNDYKSMYDAAEKEKNQALVDLKEQKKWADSWNQKNMELMNTDERKTTQLQEAGSRERKLQSKVAELEATKEGLHRQVDDLQASHNHQIQSETTEAALELVQAHQEMESIFKHLGEGLRLKAYIDHVREQVVPSLNVARPGSSDSLGSLFEGPHPADVEIRANNRHVSGASLAEEINNEEDQSAGEDFLQQSKKEWDATPSASTTATKKKKKGHRAGVRHKKPKKPAEPETIDTKPEEIDAKPEIIDDKPDEAVENNAKPVEAVEIVANANKEADEIIADANKDAGDIIINANKVADDIIAEANKKVQTDAVPVEPAPQPVEKPLAVQMQLRYYEGPLSISEICRRMPWWLWLAFTLMVVVWACLWGQAAYMRRIWLDVNDLPRQAVVNYQASMSSPRWLAPYVYDLEEWLGVDYSRYG